MAESGSEEGSIRFGSFMFDVRARALYQHGVLVPLGARALDILALLVGRPGSLVPKSAIIDAVWPDLFVEENNLHVQVSAIRKAIGAGAIRTVAGRGYRFALPVEPAGAASGREERPKPGTEALAGREEEQAALLALLDEARIVTLVGPGGVGKTALARSVAARATGAPPIWIDLAGLTAAEDLFNAVAVAAALPATAGESETALADQLGTVLLVLDSAEHLLPDLAVTVEALLAAAPAVSVLATSLVRLRVRGEALFRLDGLAAPPSDAPWQDATRYPAVRLFEARARASDRRFAICEANAAAVAELCRRLEGNPLALELAAARIESFGIAGLVGHLDRQLDLLASGAAGAPRRQQSLRRLLEWSTGLLPPELGAAFDALGAWAGTFDADTAHALIGGEAAGIGATLELLSALVDYSLLATTSDDPPSYRLSEAARAFALQRLAEAGDPAPVLRAAAAHERAAAEAAAASREGVALTHLNAALALVSRLPASRERDRLELRLLLQLGPAVQTVHSPAADRCRDLYRKATALARAAGTSEDQFKALWGDWHYLSMVGRIGAASGAAAALLEVAERDGATPLLVEGRHAAMTTALLQGDAPRVVALAAQIAEAYDAEAHHLLALDYGGHDPAVCALGQAAVALWLTGAAEEAEAAARRSLALAERLRHLHSVAVARFYGAIAFQASGRQAAFLDWAEALAALSREQGMEALELEAELLLARARWEADGAAGSAAIGAPFRRLVESGEEAFLPYYASLFGEALAAEGDHESALAAVAAAGHARDNEQGFYLPELMRIEAIALAGGDRPSRERLEAALALAERQGAAALAAKIRPLLG